MNAVLLRYALILATLAGGPGYIHAQSFPELHFQRLTEKDGLSNNAVTDIRQDKSGFLWIATDNGLNRYDGYRFKRFYHIDGDSNSLPGNSISHLALDANDNIWVSTHTGLGYFNSHSQRCEPIRHQPGKPAVLERYEVPAVYIDPADRVWVNTHEGLYGFDNQLNYHKEEGVGIDPYSFFDLNLNHYNQMVRDKKGRLWASAGNRVYLLDTNTHRPLKTYQGPADLNVIKLYFDQENRCWITGWSTGLYEFVPEQSLFRHIDLGGLRVYYSPLTEWTVDGKRWLVIGSEDNSFALLDPLTEQYHKYTTDGMGHNILSSINTYSLFVDHQNILWFGTIDGLQYVTPSSTFFDIIPVFQLKKGDYHTGTSFLTAYSLLSDESGNWVGGWWAGGICRYDRQWRLKKYIPYLNSNTNPGPFSNKSAHAFRREGRSIYCTSDSGILAIDTGNYRIRAFSPSDEKFAYSFRSILPVGEHLWWIRTREHGIYVFDVARQKFIKHYTYREGCSHCLPAARISGMVRAPDGAVYITTSVGLYEYRPGTDDFVAYTRNKNDSLTFPTEDLDAIDLDSSGRAWIGTEEGVCVFNIHTKKIEKTFPENSTMGYVSRLCVDTFQNVWFKSASSYWCWLRDKNRLLHFSMKDWLPGQPEVGLLQKGDDENVYAGDEGALIRYYPKKLMDLATPAAVPIAVSDIQANNQVLPFRLNAKKEKFIELTPSQNTFTVDFAVLNYDGVGGNKYYYRLLPDGKQWGTNENGHLMFYNLRPGNYRLEVKGGNEWSGEFPGGDVLLIRVEPHWWQTGWFFAACLLAGLFTALFFIRRRISFIREQAAYIQQHTAFRQKIAETEMQALRAQMNPHFIFNSLNSIENFMMKNDKRMASDYFGKFATLIRMILDSSRSEWVPFGKDMEALRLYVELEQLRFDHRFRFIVAVDPVLLTGNYSVPPLLIQPYVENAILHGLAQSEKEDQQLLLTAAFKEGYLIYTIEDNGIGRRKAEEFRKQKLAHVGMGMRITRQRIEILNQQQGKLSVVVTDLFDEDGEGCGTRVEVSCYLQ